MGSSITYKQRYLRKRNKFVAASESILVISRMIKADYYQNEGNLNASFLSLENRVGEDGCCA